ncbi:hypothetical protein J6590_027133 [Homalodisca vitripennis]|nr:hypothetical protein J6590_027133 [Homalodisca vitripennis]
MPSTWLPQLDPGREQFANKITDMKGKSIGFPVLERKQPSYLREMGFCAVHCSVDPSLAICWMTSEIANRIIGSPEGGKHLGIANSVDLWLRNGWEDNFNSVITDKGVRTPNTPRLTEGTTRSHSREMAAAAALPHLGIHCADNGNRHNRTATDKTCTTRGVMEAVQRHGLNCSNR